MHGHSHSCKNKVFELGPEVQLALAAFLMKPLKLPTQ
jgi:hypothetical protein